MNDEYLRQIEEDNRVLREKWEAAEKKSEASISMMMASFRILRHFVDKQVENKMPETVNPLVKKKITRGEKKKIKQIVERLISNPDNEPLWLDKPFVDIHLDKTIDSYMCKIAIVMMNEYFRYEGCKTLMREKYPEIYKILYGSDI